MNTEELLNKAADRVEVAWTQGNFRSRGGDADHCAVCALGALYWTLTGDPAGAVLDQADVFALTDARYHLRRTIEDETSGPHTVVDWNDEPGRTQGEVASMMRRAAARAKEAAS